jgi:hypothetical protein
MEKQQQAVDTEVVFRQVLTQAEEVAHQAVAEVITHQVADGVAQSEVKDVMVEMQ